LWIGILKNLRFFDAARKGCALSCSEPPSSPPFFPLRARIIPQAPLAYSLHAAVIANCGVPLTKRVKKRRLCVSTS
jgi:hypothetical protein